MSECKCAACVRQNKKKGDIRPQGSAGHLSGLQGRHQTTRVGWPLVRPARETSDHKGRLATCPACNETSHHKGRLATCPACKGGIRPQGSAGHLSGLQGRHQTTRVGWPLVRPARETSDHKGRLATCPACKETSHHKGRLATCPACKGGIRPQGSAGHLSGLQRDIRPQGSAGHLSGLQRDIWPQGSAGHLSGLQGRHQTTRVGWP